MRISNSVLLSSYNLILKCHSKRFIFKGILFKITLKRTLKCPLIAFIYSKPTSSATSAYQTSESEKKKSRLGKYRILMITFEGKKLFLYIYMRYIKKQTTQS